MAAEGQFGPETELFPAAVDLQHRVADFRAAWKRGSRPSISDCLKDVAPHTQAELFRELLDVEFACRMEKRDPPALAEYMGPYSSYGEIIKELFDKHVKGPELEGYERLDFLGGGGMGVVYKARHLGFDRPVAIKFLAENALKNDKMIARFRQESHSIGQLSHENIVQAHDAGEVEGRQFLVMEFVEGVCLADLIRGRDGLPHAEVCEIVRQVCNGLEYARKKGVVHRDIKPSNLMLTPEGVVKILDFGLACIKIDREDSQGLTEGGCAMGTLDYMAPEQFDARNVDHRADIYSLGCTMFHLLTGRPPFGLPEYASDIAKMKAHAVDPTPRADVVRKDVPRAVADVAFRMMAKHRDDRYETAAEAAKALTPLAKGADLTALAGQYKPGVLEPDTTPDPLPPTVPAGDSKTRRTRDRLVAHYRKNSRSVLAIAGGLVLASVLFMVLVRRFAPKHAPIPFEDAVATLPGLDGNWWFNEIPWLTPRIRQEWIRGLLAHAKDPNSDKGAAFGKFVAELTDELNGMRLNKLKGSLFFDDSRTAKDENHSLVAMVGITSLAKYYQNLDKVRRTLAALPDASDAKDSIPAKTRSSAADDHLLALVCHRMANLPDGARSTSKAPSDPAGKPPTREELWDTAKAHYELASAEYGRQADYQMQALCLADWGQLEFDRQENADAKKRFTSALAALHDQGLKAPFFEVYVNCCCCDACCELGSLPEARGYIKQAEESASELPDDHPLRAYLMERKGWCFMDAVEPERASECFEDAIARRKKIGAVPDNDQISERVIILFDQHGLALAEQYRAILMNDESAEDRKKHLTNSQDQFDQLLDNIKKTYSNASKKANLRAMQDLTDRWTNSAERSADGYLFGDPLADPEDFRRAAKRYGDALEPPGSNQENADLADRSSLAANLALKKAMALACAGDPRDLDAATKSFEQAKLILDSLTPAEQASLDLAKFAAESLIRWKQTAADQRVNVEQDIIKGLAARYRTKLADQADHTDVSLKRDDKLLDNLLCGVVDPQGLHKAALRLATTVSPH